MIIMVARSLSIGLHDFSHDVIILLTLSGQSG